jgi:hypothetical protein
MPPDRGQQHDYDDAMNGQLLGVAAYVLRSFGSAFGGKHLAIVGGAVPSLRVPDPPRGIERHVGTGDLDFHPSLHLMDGETADYYAAIIDRLRGLGLRPANEDGREIKWRWVGRYRNIALPTSTPSDRVRTRTSSAQSRARSSVVTPWGRSRPSERNWLNGASFCSEPGG